MSQEKTYINWECVYAFCFLTTRREKKTLNGKNRVEQESRNMEKIRQIVNVLTKNY